MSPTSWSCSTKKLGPKSKTVQALIDNGFEKLEDLLFIFPLKNKVIPKFSTLDHAIVGEYFRGVGEVLALQERGSFKAKGKRGTPLLNLSLTVQDLYSPHTISLKWFNLYPSQVQKIKSMSVLTFQGEVGEYLGQAQIVSPDFTAVEKQNLPPLITDWDSEAEVLTQYPTVNSISPHHIKQVIKKIPKQLWDQIEDQTPQEILRARSLPSLEHAFKILHGKCPVHDLTDSNIEKAHKRILYNQLVENQVKLNIRRDQLQETKGIHIPTEQSDIDKITAKFPYKLTNDQHHSLTEIMGSFTQTYPMMRLLQGDVGSGKTTVAFVSAVTVIDKGYQAALMCPTESLATQHYQTFIKLFPHIRCELLTGGVKNKKRKEILNDLDTGELSMVVGTHSLIQDDISFNRLAYAIIDEQHKFGVKQRIKLTTKGNGVHCLLMTATPIPRSLRLAQYGDLDVSVIKQIPSNRKGISTRIVTPDNYEKYLSFMKTRLSMGEQGYLVVAAIEESDLQDINNIHSVFELYKTYFPDYAIDFLHGQMKSEEKNDILNRFYHGDIQLLISTSVVEVGIDNPQATIMAILNPERFGLSSLHQLRGRVGRGAKPGFCFLVNDKEVSASILERLKVIEGHTDGFHISEEDLRLRGEGDLFGKTQSGISHIKVKASEYPELLNWANQDTIYMKKELPNVYTAMKEKYLSELYVTKTI